MVNVTIYGIHTDPMGMNGYRPENPQIVALGTDQQRRPDGSGLAFSRAALGSDFMVLEVKKMRITHRCLVLGGSSHLVSGLQPWL